MTPLISLEQAKAALRLTHNDDDALIEDHIDAASEAVMQYLNRDVSWFDPETNTLGDVPFRVQKATEHLVMLFYDEPLGDAFDHRRMPSQVTSILFPMRKLSLG